MNKQEAFNQAVRGVIAQGKPALDPEGGCIYRAPDGCKCAVSMLFTEEDFKLPIIELNSNPVLFPKDLINRLGGDTLFLQDLQAAHDDAATSPDDFVRIFKLYAISVAAAHNLDASVVNRDLSEG